MAVMLRLRFGGLEDAKSVVDMLHGGGKGAVYGMDLKAVLVATFGMSDKGGCGLVMVT